MTRLQSFTFFSIFVCFFLNQLQGVFGQTKVVLTNDDGWAVANIRALFSSLTEAKFNVVLSAPAENQSGTGSLDLPATTVGSSGCEFSSCPAGAPAEGFNMSEPRLNYVNSFPVTSVKFGISTVAPEFFSGGPDIVLSGPNVGSNTGIGTLGSGTVGAATAAGNEGFPAIAFSGVSGSQVSFTTLDSPSDSTTAAAVYGQLATSFTQTLLSSPEPILPSGVTLNVNFAASIGNCTEPSDFSFVLTRIYPAIPILTPKDVTTCGSNRLPTEDNTLSKDGTQCLSTVSVMDSATKLDSSAANQAIVLGKLSTILVCP